MLKTSNWQKIQETKWNSINSIYAKAHKSQTTENQRQSLKLVRNTVPTTEIIAMTSDFSSKIMEPRKKWHNIFQVLRELSTWNCIYDENILTEWRGNKTSSDEEKLRDLFSADPSSKYSQGILRTAQKQENSLGMPGNKRRTEVTKIWAITISCPSPLMVSKLCLRDKAKLQTLMSSSNCKGNM